MYLIKKIINNFIIFIFSKLYSDHYSVVNSNLLNPYQKSRILFRLPRNLGKYYTKKIREFSFVVDISEYGGIAFLFNVDHVFKSHKYLLNLHVKKNDIVFDVGSNIGIFSLFAAYNGAYVHAFEPEKKNYNNLEFNKNINNFENITTVNFAIGNTSGSTTLFLNELNAGTHTTIKNEIIMDRDMYGNSKNKDEIVEVKVDIEKLDQYIKFKEKIKLIKIDTEGNEIDVLLGMQQLLKYNPPSLIMIEDRGGVDRFQNKYKEYVNILNQYDYNIFYFTDAGLSGDKSKRVNMSDVLFVHRDYRKIKVKNSEN